jgi:hypothetical protein
MRRKTNIHKVFGSKVYTYSDWCPSKAEAQAKAQNLRLQGVLVRVVKTRADKRYVQYHLWTYGVKKPVRRS